MKQLARTTSPETTPLPAPPPGSTARAHRRALDALAAFSSYLAVSFVLFAIPVLSHFGTRFAGAGEGDARFFAWDLAWWPHAIAAGIDPFRSRAVWFPGGIDLAWVTGIPGPSLAMWPVTRWLGPIASNNLLTVASPALAGLGAYLLGRRLTPRFWPALAGGYVFGFDAYEVGQLRGHINLFLIFPVPFAAYLFVRAVDGSLGERAFTLLLALTLVAEFSISIEIFATATVFGAIAIVGFFLFGPRELRTSLRRAVVGTGLAYALALAVLGPYLYHLAIGAAPNAHHLPHASADLLSFVLPRSDILIGGAALAKATSSFASRSLEDGAYLPIPILVVLVLCGIAARRDRVMRLLAIFAGIAALAALGPVLMIAGRQTIPLPWAIASHLPLLRYALPQRFTLYMWLAIAMLVVRWLSQTPAESWPRYATVALGALLLLPNVASGRLHTPQPIPAFFRTPTDAERLAPAGHSLLVLHPLKGQEMLWQADTSFAFAMPQGHMGNEPPPFRDDRVWRAIRDDRPDTIDPRSLLAFLREHLVSAVVVTPGSPPGWRPLLEAAGLLRRPLDGVHVYRRPPPGGHPRGRRRHGKLAAAGSPVG